MSQLSASTFTVDLSPPPGVPTNGGLSAPSGMIEHPLLGKGIILVDAGGISVICALDYGALCNDSYDDFIDAIATGAGCSPDRVIINNLHSHTSMAPDANTQRVLEKYAPELANLTWPYVQDCLEKLRHAAEEAVGRLKKVKYVQSSWAVVDRLASNRRILQPDGTIATRLSSTKIPYLQMLPDGLIDPFMRTVNFLDENDKSIVCLHTYATHPQTSWGEGRISSDVPGIARSRMEAETGTPHLYFTGCGGNIAMGRYNDSSFESRTALAGRMFDAMYRSLHSEQKQTYDASELPPCEWVKVPVAFEKRQEEEFTSEYNLLRLQDESLLRAKALELGLTGDAVQLRCNEERIKSAMLLAINERMDAGIPWEIKAVHLGPFSFLSLPGETFIEYQLYAQELVGQNIFLCTFGYNDCAMWYLGPDCLYREKGGFEITWAFAGPNEKTFKQAINRALKR